MSNTLASPLPTITGSMLYDFVVCPHKPVMDHFGPPDERAEPNEFVQMLWERGSAHETELVATLSGVLSLRPVPVVDRERATLEAMAARVPLIHGGRITDAAWGFVGEPDLLRLTPAGYEPGDIKAAGANDADPATPGTKAVEHAVQLAHYVAILQSLGCATPERRAFVLNGAGKEVSYDLDECRGGRSGQSWWEHYQACVSALRSALAASGTSSPARAGACKLCPWKAACKRRLQAADDLTLISELGRSKRDTLAPAYPTVAALASADLDQRTVGFPGIGEATLRRFQARAKLLTTPGALPYTRQPLQLPTAAREIYFDLETDPLRDHVYLHGFVERSAGQAPEAGTFRPVFCDGMTAQHEEAAFAEAWRYLRARAADSLVFYYSRFEWTSYKALALKYPRVCSLDEVNALFRLPTVIDLYTDVVKKHTEWPTNDYSVKTLAVYLGFQWRDPNPSGAASIEWYNEWVKAGDPALRARVLEYNEDDCRATGVVVDGLRALPVA